MNDRLLNSAAWSAVSALGITAVFALLGHTTLALGTLAGAAWNLASLWCLTRLLNAWLGPHPSRWQALGWLMVKFPLLYLALIALLRTPACSVVGFGIGFTIVLAVQLGRFVIQPQPLSLTRSYGR